MAYPGYDAFCRECGKPIIFIRTPKGKLMPCDAQPVPYWRTNESGVLIYQLDGSSIKAMLSGHESACTGYGYRPHWASCTERREGMREKARKNHLAEYAARRTEQDEQLHARLEKRRAEAARKEARAAEKCEKERRLREAEARQFSLFGEQP